VSPSRPTSPLTPRHKKSSRSIKMELEMVITNCVKMDERVQLTLSIVTGAIEEMVAAAKSAHDAMEKNAKTLAKPEAKPLVDALKEMAGHSERAETSLRTTLGEVTSFRGMLTEIMDDLREHHRVRVTALSLVGENAMMPPANQLNDANSRAAILIAGQREDVARQSCTKALKQVRSMRSDLELRRSKMRLAMTHQRDAKVKRDKEIRLGNFGSTGARVTDPASRKLHTTPETTRG